MVDINRPPSDQPGLWCDWEPDDRGALLSWNETEKFYNYVEWIEYLIANFFEPWGRVISGDVHWQGDNDEDAGTIRVRQNKVDVLGPIVVHQGQQLRRLRAFLCHASEDKRRVRALARRLKDDNIDPWLDETRLLPGSDWAVAIREALRSCDAVILCLSEVAVRKRGFVQREIKLAQNAAEEEPEGELFLFPTLLEPCDVPTSLRRLQRVDLGRRGGYAQLLTGLAARAQSLSSHRPASSRRKSENASPRMARR